LQAFALLHFVCATDLLIAPLQSYGKTCVNYIESNFVICYKECICNALSRLRKSMVGLWLPLFELAEGGYIY